LHRQVGVDVTKLVSIVKTSNLHLRNPVPGVLLNLAEKNDRQFIVRYLFFFQQVKIEPLPLLDKVVTKFRKQQEKVKQHMALNRAYFNMVRNKHVSPCC